MRTRTSRPVRLMWIALCAGAAAVVIPAAGTGAQPRQDQPGERPPRPDRMPGSSRDGSGPGEFGGGGFGGPGGPGFGGGGFGGGGFRSRFPPPSDEEWQEAAAFAQKYSPNRLDALERLDEFGRDRLRAVLSWRYGAMSRLREDDPPLYDLRLQRLQLEDQVFGALRDLRTAPDSDVEAKRQVVRAKVADLIKNGLAERLLRLEKLEKQMAAERARYEKDRANLEALVDVRMQEIEAEREGPLAEMLMRRGDGPGGERRDGAGARSGPDRRPGGQEADVGGGGGGGGGGNAASVEEAMRRRRARETGGNPTTPAAP